MSSLLRHGQGDGSGAVFMSLEGVRLVYPILVQIARDCCQAAQARQTLPWTSYEELCAKCREIGIKENPRTIQAKVLKPLQQACIDNEKPDLSALIIQKPKARGDFGNLIRPADGWWDVYVERKELEAVGDVAFWFERYRKARDFAEWPDDPFF